MKKSEILRILSKESINNVNSYYRPENIDLLIVYCNVITWQGIKNFGDKIVDITASENNDGKIRVSFDNVIFD